MSTFDRFVIYAMPYLLAIFLLMAIVMMALEFHQRIAREREKERRERELDEFIRQHYRL